MMSKADVFFWVSNILFGSVGLIFLFDVYRRLKEFWRRRSLSPEEREEEDTWALGGSFSLRRSDSALRSRHVHKDLAEGRLTELNKMKRDPDDP